MSLPATRAWYAAQAGLVLASHLVTVATPSLNILLAMLYCKIQSLQVIESMPPGPAAPCILAATFST
eukprot:2740884-Ditylum_brightwellii.AAC.1